MAFLCTIAATAAAAAGAVSPFPSMVFMENNTADGPNREGLNFTIEQEWKMDTAASFEETVGRSHRCGADHAAQPGRAP